MADDSKIEWTDATWNVITGCSMASPGCANCYAMKLAGTRLHCHPSRRGLTKMVNGQPVWTGEVRFNDAWIYQPLQWIKPRKIFVCAHSDLFHENIPDDWIDAVFGVMWACLYNRHGQDGHIFQLLTKRPGRMLEYLSQDRREQWASAAVTYGGGINPDGIYDQTRDFAGPHPRIWFGVTAENQEMADERIPLLLQCPAAKRFVSIEPMLGHVDLEQINIGYGDLNALTGKIWMPGNCGESSRTIPSKSKLDWVIAGGESGHNARPMHPDWLRSVRDQCAAAAVLFMFKQWGEWVPAERDKYGNVEFCDQNTVPHDGFLKLESKDIGGGFSAFKFGKKRAGHLLDGQEHMQFPEIRP